MSSRNFYTDQFGVIHRRRILECIIIASEAINYLERTNNGHNMIVKDDIEKASNTMFRDFILDVIRCFGFVKLSGLDFDIVQSSMIVILLNGYHYGFLNTL